MSAQDRAEPTIVRFHVTNYHNSDSENTTYRIAWSVDPEISADEVDMRTRKCRGNGAVGAEIVKGPKARDKTVKAVLDSADDIATRRRIDALEALEIRVPVSLEDIAQLAARAAAGGDKLTVSLAGRALAGDNRAVKKVEKLVRELRSLPA